MLIEKFEMFLFLKLCLLQITQKYVHYNDHYVSFILILCLPIQFWAKDLPSWDQVPLLRIFQFSPLLTNTNTNTDTLIMP